MLYVTVVGMEPKESPYPVSQARMVVVVVSVAVMAGYDCAVMAGCHDCVRGTIVVSAPAPAPAPFMVAIVAATVGWYIEVMSAASMLVSTIVGSPMTPMTMV